LNQVKDVSTPQEEEKEKELFSSMHCRLAKARSKEALG